MRANGVRNLDVCERGHIVQQRWEDLTFFQTLQNALRDHQHSLLVRRSLCTHLMRVRVLAVESISIPQVLERRWLYVE